MRLQVCDVMSSVLACVLKWPHQKQVPNFLFQYSGRTIEVNLHMVGVGVSVVDDAPEELCFLSMRNMRGTYIASNIEQDIDFSVDAVQVRVCQSFSQRQYRNAHKIA